MLNAPDWSVIAVAIVVGFIWFFNRDRPSPADLANLKLLRHLAVKIGSRDSHIHGEARAQYDALRKIVAQELTARPSAAKEQLLEECDDEHEESLDIRRQQAAGVNVVRAGDLFGYDD